ncbi:MAG: glutamine amidotransferase [Flavobacteriaceae bacterium]
MSKILILQMRPEDVAADSEFEAILRVGGIPASDVDRIRVEEHADVRIDLEKYCAIIAGGSPFDVSKDEKLKDPVQKGVEEFFSHLFDQLIKADFPFLGACSGNGLLGRYCGTPISGKYSEDIGSAMVTMTEEGRKDPLLLGLPDSFEAMVGHKEACDNVPEGSVLLLTSKNCPVQMFRLKENIYATQFHPEADADEFIIRVKTYMHSGYFAPERAEELIGNIRKIDTPEPKKILRRFVKRYGRFTSD